MTNRKLRSHHLIYILFAVFYLWMAAQIPYTHDDWDWGLEVGMQQWLTASVNSRYTGNFFEIIMTRSVFLKTVIMGGTFFLLPYLLSSITAKISKNDSIKPLLFLASNFLILSMSRLIWSETYGWVAGFANFGLSSVFVLLCASQWLPLCEKAYIPRKHNLIIDIVWLLIAFFGQLFIENVSIIMGAFSVLVCICSYIRAKKIPRRYILMCIGMIAGLCVMFSSSVYASLFSSGEAVDGYRQLIVSAESGLVSKLYNIFVQAARLVTRAGEANFVLCIAVLCVLTIKSFRISNNKLSKAFIAVNALFAVYFAVNFVLQTDYTPDKVLLSAFAALVNGLYFLTVAVEVFFIYRNDSTLQRKLLSVWFIGIAFLAPLIVTNEAGYRLIFSLNIMVNLFVLFVLQDILCSVESKTVTKVAFVTAAIIPAIVCGIVYSAIGNCNRVRMDLIEMAAFYEASEVRLPVYPHANYLHAPNPIDDLRMGFFKEFYGIDSHVQVIFETQN